MLKNMALAFGTILYAAGSGFALFMRIRGSRRETLFGSESKTQGNGMAIERKSIVS
jgi:hypothetical protein